MGILIFQKLVVEFFLDFVYFPLWWYTKGALKAFCAYKNALVAVNFRLAPGLWLKNIFTPMYGQRDWEGRLVSVFIRFWNVIFRGVLLVIAWTVYTIIIMAYFLLFPLIFFLLISSSITL
ncbi:hypothetical protein H6758_02735 [Candidatus Nomurabacteria bacterium]|nr:hypothetical protein [Candidatus Nomurabacteria bacterium]